MMLGAYRSAPFLHKYCKAQENHKNLTGAWKPSLFIAGRKSDTGHSSQRIVRKNLSNNIQHWELFRVVNVKFFMTK